MNNQSHTQSNSTSSATVTVKNAYDAKVINETLNRVGKCPNAKGHIHEVMYRDLQNILPKNILKGNKAKLVVSNTAECVDLVVVDSAGKTIERVQLKDTSNSIAKTIKQVESGKYNSAQMVGTKETTDKFNKGYKGAKKMKSSHISSKTTEQMAVKSGNVELTSKTGIRALKNSAIDGGLWGGIGSGAISTVSNMNDLVNGDKELDEAAMHIAIDTGKGAVSGAGGNVAATVSGPITAGILSHFGLSGALATATIAGTPILVGLTTAGAINAVLSRTGDNLSDNINSAVDGLTGTVENIGSTVGDIADKTVTPIEDGLTSLAEGAVNTIEEAGGTVIDIAGGLLDGVENTFDNICSWFS